MFSLNNVCQINTLYDYTLKNMDMFNDMFYIVCIKSLITNVSGIDFVRLFSKKQFIILYTQYFI